MKNSIEEAVKTMEHWIAYEKNNKDKINKADELINIQETILSEYKRVLKENEELLEVKVSASAHNRILELEKENEELRAKWDKDTHILQNELDLTNADKINNYIPVQKVKDKIEELKEEKEYYYSLEKIEELDDKIQVLQELIEGRK